MTIIFDGRRRALEWEGVLRQETERQKRKLAVTVILAGEDKASLAYIGLKEKLAARLGVGFCLVRIPEVMPNEGARRKIEDTIQALNKDGRVDGILVQLPLPGKLRDIQRDIVSIIDRQKDVDGLRDDALVWPAVVRAVKEVLSVCRLPISDYRFPKAVVIGSGFVAQKTEKYLRSLKNGEQIKIGEVLRVAGREPRLAEYTREADIIISCVGRAGLITGDVVKEGAVVLDLGTMPVETSTKKQAPNIKLQGDVDFESVATKASFITPVPGGIGPMTVVALFANLIDLAR